MFSLLCPLLLFSLIDGTEKSSFQKHFNFLLKVTDSFDTGNNPFIRLSRRGRKKIKIRNTRKNIFLKLRRLKTFSTFEIGEYDDAFPECLFLS